MASPLCPAQEVSALNNFYGDCSCDRLSKILTVFCPFPKNLSEAKLKTNELISLLEAILGQHNIKSVVWLLLLLF